MVICRWPSTSSILFTISTFAHVNDILVMPLDLSEIHHTMIILYISFGTVMRMVGDDDRYVEMGCSECMPCMCSVSQHIITVSHHGHSSTPKERPQVHIYIGCIEA